MQTIKIKYTIDDTDKLLLNDYIKQYNHVYRVAFNNLQSHKKNKLAELTNLNNIDLLDSWFIQSANYESKFLYNSIGDKKVTRRDLSILTSKITSFERITQDY